MYMYMTLIIMADSTVATWLHESSRFIAHQLGNKEKGKKEKGKRGKERTINK